MFGDKRNPNIDVHTKQRIILTHMYIHTHIYIYIYIYPQGEPPPHHAEEFWVRPWFEYKHD